MSEKSNTNAVVLSVSDFCLKYRVSRTYLYKLWRTDIGPPRKKVGNKIFIPIEGADSWFNNLPFEITPENQEEANNDSEFQ